MAEIAGRSESTVRAWGDPNRREEIPFPSAIALDLAYRGAGGDGAPLFETYACQLDHAGVFHFADEIALGRLAAQSIRESGEAHAALIVAAQPGADDRARRYARQQAEEALAVMHRILPVLSGEACTARMDEAAEGHPATGPPR